MTQPLNYSVNHMFGIFASVDVDQERLDLGDVLQDAVNVVRVLHVLLLIEVHNQTINIYLNAATVVEPSLNLLSFASC